MAACLFHSLFQPPFHPVVYWLDVPREVAEEFHSEFEDAVDLFTGYPAGDRERQFTTWGTRDGIYLSGSDPEKPGVFVLAQTGKGRQGLDLDELDVDPDATFVEGFSQGFVSGGVEMVQDGISLFEWVGKKAERYWKLTVGGGSLIDQIDADCQAFIGTLTGATKIVLGGAHACAVLGGS